MAKQMTYRETVSDFMWCVHPIIVAHFGNDDEIAMNESWNNYVDALCKAGDIPDESENWELPDSVFGGD